MRSCLVAIAALIALSSAASADAILAPDRARQAAIQILMGDPYGKTTEEVARNIRSQSLISRDANGCRVSRTQPGYLFEVSVKDRPSGEGPIEGYFIIDAKTGKTICAGLPFLD